MNSLSWTIYLIQVVDGVRTTLQVFAGIALLITALVAIPAFIGKYDEVCGDGTLFAAWKPWAWKIVPVAIGIIVCGNLLPNRTTMLLIASSEIGGRALHSQAAKDIIDPGMELLKTWIKRETEKLAKESK